MRAGLFAPVYLTVDGFTSRNVFELLFWVASAYILHPRLKRYV